MKKIYTLFSCTIFIYSLAAQIPSSGNVLWLKSDNGVYINTSSTAATNGQLVQVWADQSGNGNDFDQPVNGKRPQFITNGLCTKPVVRFTISRNTYMQSPFKLSGAKSIFMVFVLPSLSNSAATLLSIKGNNGVFTEIVGTDFSSYKPMSYVQDLSGTSSASGTLNVVAAEGNTASFSTSGNLFTLVYDGTASTSNSAYSARYDAAPVSVSSSGNFGRKLEDTTSIGARVPQQNINYFTGDLAEVIVYNRALSSAEVLQVENYLSAKYGLSGSCITLNVGFKKMDATVNNKTVSLYWEAENPETIKRFIIQQSVDGRQYKNIGEAGNSSSLVQDKKFSFSHVVTSSGTYFYRIAAQQVNGNPFYSEIKKVVISTNKNYLTISPNPGKGFITLYSPDNKRVSLVICSASGQQIKALETKTNELIDVRFLNPGLYFIKTIFGNQAYTYKFVSSK